MELIHPNNCCHLCRIPQLYYASYQDLEVLSSKYLNDSAQLALDSEADEIEHYVPASREH